MKQHRFDNDFLAIQEAVQEVYENSLLRQMSSIPDGTKFLALDKNGTKVVTPMDLNSKASLNKTSDYWIRSKEIINNKGDHVDKVYFYDVDESKLYAVHTQKENPDLEEKCGICFKPEKSAKGAPYQMDKDEQ
jgi:hypothetical protein